jgi:hypothetical protein
MATGQDQRPVVALLTEVHGRIAGLPDGDDRWDRILRRTGRRGVA